MDKQKKEICGFNTCFQEKFHRRRDISEHFHLHRAMVIPLLISTDTTGEKVRGNKIDTTRGIFNVFPSPVPLKGEDGEKKNPKDC